MPLVSDLLDSVADVDHPVRRVVVGIHWIAVESRFIGIAPTYTARRDADIAQAGSLAGRSALEMARRLRTGDPLEAALGLAALNSLVEPTGTPGSVLEAITRKALRKQVTLIGKFPSYDQVVSVSRRAHMIRMSPPVDRFALPPDRTRVPTETELVVVDAAVLIDGDLDNILEDAKDMEVVIRGPATPMTDLLFEHGVSLLGGVRVVDGEKLLRSVMEGARLARHLAGLEEVVKTDS